MSSWIWIAVAVGVAVTAVLAIAFGVARSRSAGRSRRLREHFGPEYDRTVAEHRRRRDGEAELQGRIERRAELDIGPLDESRCNAYRDAWERVQSGFIDTPTAAIGEANGLVIDLMRERGYPVEDFDQRAADISVDHPGLVENYRAARAIAVAGEQGQASTEDLRQAMVHYGVVFEELLDTEDPASAATATSTSAAHGQS
jgi:hypothetical protein